MPEEMQMRLLSVAAPFAPMDGMNEKGLCVAVLMIQDSPGFHQDTGKPDLTTTTAVRLLLDQAADVEEAVEVLARYDIMLQSGSSFTMDGIRDALDSVSKHNFDSEFASTEWSIVYNQSTGEAHYYHRENYQKYYTFITGSP